LFSIYKISPNNKISEYCFIIFNKIKCYTNLVKQYIYYTYKLNIYIYIYKLQLTYIKISLFNLSVLLQFNTIYLVIYNENIRVHFSKTLIISIYSIKLF